MNEFVMNEENKNFGMLAKTMYGFESILAEEVKELGAKEVSTENRAVRFRGSLEVLYRVNYYSRLSLKILKPLAEFNARNEQDLYDKTMGIDWSRIMTVNQTFAIDSVVHSPHFTHSHYVALKVKDAIADRFRKDMGRRPNVDSKNPHIKVNVHISNTRVSLSLDSSGASLHKRGYRKGHGKASLNEVLAAGLIVLSGWDKKMPLIDPMCGSGTIIIEAALMAHDIPPGSFYREYLFPNWTDFDPELYKKIRSEKRRDTSGSIEIIGSDSSTEQIRVARLNLRNAGLSDLVVLKQKEFAKLLPSSPEGIIIMNPPYGERIEHDNLVELYKEIGNQLKKEYNGYKAFVFSAKPEALKFIGLHPSSKNILYNGEYKCMYQEYELYEGSRKHKE